MNTVGKYGGIGSIKRDKYEQNTVSDAALGARAKRYCQVDMREKMIGLCK